MSEWVAENKGKTILFIAAIFFMAVIAIVNPEPFPSISRQIQISLGTYDWGYIVVDEEENEIGDTMNWLQLMDNETNEFTIGIKSTSQVPIILEISFDGAELEEQDFNNSIREVWHFPSIEDSKISFICDYNETIIESHEICWIRFQTLVVIKSHGIFTVTLKIEAKSMEGR